MTRTKKNDPSDPYTPLVDRGGSWGIDEASWVRSASHSAYEPANRRSYLGFRTSLTGRQPR